MKKKTKIALAALLMLVFAGAGAYRTYVQSDVAMSEQDLMVVENVLALTEYNNPVENGTVEIVSSTFTCHKLATDKSDKQTAIVNVDGWIKRLYTICIMMIKKRLLIARRLKWNDMPDSSSVRATR